MAAVASDEAVRSATGKAWDEWVEIISEVQAGRTWTHKEIVAH